MLQKSGNNPTKTAQKQGFQPKGRRSYGVPPLYVLNILLEHWGQKIPPITAREICDKIQGNTGLIFAPKTVYAALENIVLSCSNISLHTEEVHAGRSRAAAYSISFKTENLYDGRHV